MTPAMRRATGTRALIVLLAALGGGPATVFASDMQRMVLAPASCRALPAGGTVEASAYCLDQSRLPPAEGAILASVPAGLENARVLIAGAPPLSLSAALARHVLEIEGSDSDDRLQLKNTGALPVEICIDGPTVVMGNGEGDARDLAALRGEIARLLSQAPPTADEHAHAQTQQRLWEAVNAAQAAARRQSARELLAPALAPAGTSGTSGSSRKKCARGAEAADVKLCVD
jgi:hypothetical protein